MATIAEEQRRRYHGQRPLFERMQDWLFRWDIGIGAHFFRFGMFGLLVLVVVLIYTGTQFFGLKEARVMDLGQLGRNLRMGRGYVTRVIRPFDLYQLGQRGRPAIGGERTVIPELWTPPVYPLLLSTAFRVGNVNADGSPVTALQMDRLVMLTGWIFFVAGLMMLYLLAQSLFDHRVAALSAFLYLFCNPLLSDAVNGAPTGWLALCLMSMVFGLLKAQDWLSLGRSRWWTYTGLSFSALALGLGTLTEYAFAALILPWLVYVGVVFGRRRWAAMGLGAAMLLVILTPWMVRNWRVIRQPFGLSYCRVFEGVGANTRGEIRVGQLQRTFGPLPAVKLRSLARKTIINLRRLYENTVKDIGASYLIVFFLASLLHRFRRIEVLHARRLLFWGLVAGVFWASVVGVPEHNPFTLFIPLIIIYAAAFFFVLFERLQYRTRLARSAVAGIFIFLNIAPFGFALLPPRDTYPYPPYSAEVTTRFHEWFRPAELLAADIPWAVAWYADRSAVWAPFTKDDFMNIHVNQHVFAGVYVTQETLRDQTVLELFAGYQRFWMTMFQPPTPDFPLKKFWTMTPDGQQVLISNLPGSLQPGGI